MLDAVAWLGNMLTYHNHPAACTMPSPPPFSAAGTCATTGTVVESGYQCSYQCAVPFYARLDTSGALLCRNGTITRPTLKCQRVLFYQPIKIFMVLSCI